jgi:hypothetical protein
MFFEAILSFNPGCDTSRLGWGEHSEPHRGPHESGCVVFSLDVELRAKKKVVVVYPRPSKTAGFENEPSLF